MDISNRAVNVDRCVAIDDDRAKEVVYCKKRNNTQREKTQISLELKILLSDFREVQRCDSKVNQSAILLSHRLQRLYVHRDTLMSFDVRDVGAFLSLPRVEKRGTLLLFSERRINCIAFYIHVHTESITRGEYSSTLYILTITY